MPLGSPVAADYRIVPHQFDQEPAAGRIRFRIGQPPKEEESTLPKKAASIAAGAMAAVVRYIKPQTPEPAAPARPPSRTPPRGKR